MNTNRFSMLAAILFLATGAVSLGAAGCQTASAGGVCDKVCECGGCSEKERTDCVETLEDAQKAANDEGCSEQYDKYFSCTDSELACTDGQIDADGCDAEVEALYTCMDKASTPIGKNRCEAAADRLIAKFEACNITVNQDPNAQAQECTDADAQTLECYVPCYENTTCASLNGDQYDEAFLSCVNNCQ